MRKSGFTIAELLIVMVIMGLLLGIGIPNFAAQRKQLDFNQSISRILEVIKTARNYALTAKKASSGIIPREGYGVLINKNTKTFTLFANAGTGNEEIYDSTAGDTLEETYTLPDISTFESMKGMVATNEDTNVLLILFRPPLGEATLTNNLASAGVPTYKKYNSFTLTFKSPNENTVIINMNAIGGFPEVQFE